MMKSTVAAAAFAAIAIAAIAQTPAAPPTPSSSLGIDVDVKPVKGKAGQFVVNSVVTDLESHAVIAKPSLVIAANQPATIQTGNEGKWMLRIRVAADGSARTANYEATFTREGKLVSQQRVSVALES